MVVTTGSAGVLAMLSGLLGLAPDVPIQRAGQAQVTPSETAAPTETAPPAPNETAAPADPVAPDEAAAPTEAAAPNEAAAPDEDAAPTETGDATTPAEPTTPPSPAIPTDPVDLAQAYASTTHDLDDRDRQLRRASSLIAGGAVAATAGLVMLIGAATEAAKPECKFDLDTCANAPRPAVARGLGIGSAIALAGGAAMIGYGLHRRHRLMTSFGADANSVAMTVSGRF